jgi:hypothetical protein
MNGRAQRREIKRRCKSDTTKAAVLRKQDKMATIAVRKGRLYYPVSLVKYQRT